MLSVARQASHLSRVLPAGLGGGRLLVAIGGLIHAGLALPRGNGLVQRGSRLLERELKRLFLADGGHRERSPSVQFAMLRLLAGVRAALAAAERPLPAGLDDAIRGMAQMRACSSTAMAALRCSTTAMRKRTGWSIWRWRAPSRPMRNRRWRTRGGGQRPSGAGQPHAGDRR
jgi:uncharacterized heparinase superfamily protein